MISEHGLDGETSKAFPAFSNNTTCALFTRIYAFTSFVSVLPIVSSKERFRGLLDHPRLSTLRE